MKKTYEIGIIKYGFSLGARKWIFKSERYQFSTPVVGGASTAHHIAKLVNAGLIRTNGEGIDAIARNAINKKLQVAS